MDTGNFWEEICWTLTYSHDIYQDRFCTCCCFRPPGPRSWDRTVESRYDQNASQPTVYESTARTSAPQPVSSGKGAGIWTMVIMLYSMHIPLDSLDSIFQGKPGGATNNEGFNLWFHQKHFFGFSFLLRNSWLNSVFLMIKQRRDQIPKASLTKFLQSWWDQEPMPFLAVFATPKKGRNCSFYQEFTWVYHIPWELRVSICFHILDQRRVPPGCAEVMSALEGYNATIVAYGPTSTGKTYTMEGGLKAMMEAGNLNGWGWSSILLTILLLCSKCVIAVRILAASFHAPWRTQPECWNGETAGNLSMPWPLPLDSKAFGRYLSHTVYGNAIGCCWFQKPFMNAMKMFILHLMVATSYGFWWFNVGVIHIEAACGMLLGFNPILTSHFGCSVWLPMVWTCLNFEAFCGFWVLNVENWWKSWISWLNHRSWCLKSNFYGWN